MPFNLSACRGVLHLNGRTKRALIRLTSIRVALAVKLEPVGRQGLALPSSLPSPLAASATAVSAAQGYPT
eukprot:s2278_g4.t1